VPVGPGSTRGLLPQGEALVLPQARVERGQPELELVPQLREPALEHWRHR
jgi:hypothetical protein